MTDSTPSVRHQTPPWGWRAQLLVLGLLALLGTVPFWLTDLDLWVAGLFHHPLADDPWFEAQAPLWTLLYASAPLLTALLLLGSLLVLMLGRYHAALRRRRWHAIFLIATLVLGPGLVVNGIFKDHWGRPRPHQVQELGGTRDYLPPLMMGEPGRGKSFPCGHSSVGFALSAFFLIWQRRRPRLAWLALIAALGLGSLLGVARMAAGDHFLSDVIWSAVMVHGVALVLYAGILRLPRREQAQIAQAVQPRHSPLATLAQLGLAVLMLVGVLFATPLKRSGLELVEAGELSPEPRVLRIEADTATVTLDWAENPPWRARLRLDARGFGLPWSRAETALTLEGERLVYRIRHQGVFSERDTRLKLQLAPADWERVEIVLARGDIQLDTGSGAALPELDLHTADGDLVPKARSR